MKKQEQKTEITERALRIMNDRLYSILLKDGLSKSFRDQYIYLICLERYEECFSVLMDYIAEYRAGAENYLLTLAIIAVKAEEESHNATTGGQRFLTMFFAVTSFIFFILTILN